MSNIEKFEELLRSDEALQAKLKAAADAFVGDESDEAEVFRTVIAPLAAKVGLPFTFDEARAYADDGEELEDDELEAVAGGGCFVVGLGELTDSCWAEWLGATACIGVGMGFVSSWV